MQNARVTGASAGVAAGAASVFNGTGNSQHELQRDHLPAARENVELVGSLEMNTPAQFRFNPANGQPDPSQPDVVDGQIADVAVYKNTAYLNSWSEQTCRRGGMFSVDISNPADPRQLAFMPARAGTYHGEGAHAITINIPGGFQGDVLAVNNEPCAANGTGGFELYNVTDPANPVRLTATAAGDRSADHATGEPFAPLTQNQAVSNSAHSIFVWQDGDKAYAVIVDNTELSDVDIFDITDPTAPVFITDVDLFELAIDQGVDIVDESANGDTIFHHDMVVKEINGVQTMLVSYWDSGYIKLDVSDPVNPTIIGDSDFGLDDPIMNVPGTDTPWSRPEGNGHQAEFSHDNKFVLAADEDFNQFRFLGEIDMGGGNVFNFTSVGVPDEGVQVTPADPMSGDTRFVGDACVAANIAPATPGVTIAVAERGTCNFQVKTEMAASRGYEDVIIFNNAIGANAQCDELLNLDFTNYTGTARTLFVGRSIGFRIIGAFDPATYTCVDGNAAASTPTPAAPREGNPISMELPFDGWGYMHLYKNDGADLVAVDHFAIEEGADDRFATGFGDLTVHEFATDPTENLGYVAHYAGGLRVLSFGDSGLNEVGKFIDKGGNNFWGVEQFTTQDGQRLIAASDRDFGLYLFKYTGPGAAARPVCSDLTVGTAINTPTVVPLACSDANGNTLTLRTAQPSRGSVALTGAQARYTPNAGVLGVDTFTYTANDGVADAAAATVTVIVTAPAAAAPPTGLKSGACANDLLGTAARDLVRGSTAGDRMRGGAGNDVLDGNAGDDCVLGEAGNDDLNGDAGNDDVEGGAGTDKVSGGAGRDELDGGSGNDTLDGGSGNDRVSGGNGNDKLAGAAGTDTLRGGAGRDSINARGGGRDRIDCGSGRDTVTADRNDRVARNCEVVRRR